jgi:hypothetical protein
VISITLCSTTPPFLPFLLLLLLLLLLSSLELPPSLLSSLLSQLLLLPFSLSPSLASHLRLHFTARLWPALSDAAAVVVVTHPVALPAWMMPPFSIGLQIGFKSFNCSMK